MSAEAEPVLRLALQFLDLSRDLERNREDTIFREDGGTIDYVFDANIFEIFVQPTEPRGQQTSLHGASWRRGKSTVPGQKRAAVAAQIALLTSEFMLSDDLTGNGDGKIYLSEWHSWELARRVKDLVVEHGSPPDREQLTEQLQEIASYLRSEYRASPTEMAEGNYATPVDALLHADLAEIESSNPLTAHERQAFARNRLLLAWLCRETNPLLPANQLKRLVSPPLRKRLCNFYQDYLPTDDDRAAIKADARKWHDDLVEECKLRKIPIDKDMKGARTTGALWDDARTLALVRWAGVHPRDPKQRLVFVTADDLVFDIYRKWHASLNPFGDEFAEPFVLRRPVQYAPIFNMADAGNELGEDVRAFFQRLQGVVEITLLPINLSRHGATEARAEIISRMREKTALRLLEADTKPIWKELAYADLISKIETTGIENYRKQFDEVLEDWRRLERVILGVSNNYVEQRLEDFEQTLPGFATGEISSDAITRYIDHLIRELYEGSVAFSLPLAQGAILEFLAVEQKDQRRAPIGFRLTLTDHRPLDLSQAAQDRMDGFDSDAAEAALGAKQESPDIVFGLAACVALAMEDWSNADHFAEMALRGLALQNGQDGASPIEMERSYELSYLNALTKRFRMGALGPVRNMDGLNRVRRIHREACELLDAAVEHHGQGIFPGQHRLRHFRALSERAALNLFVAASFARAVRLAFTPAPRAGDSAGYTLHRDGGFEMEIAGEIGHEAECALCAAEEDLVSCWELRNIFEGRDFKRTELLQPLEEQSAVNTAAACVLRKLIYHKGDPFSGFPNDVICRIKVEAPKWLVIAERRSPLLAAELWAFLHLSGEPEARSRLAALRRRKIQWSLTLDAALFSAITSSLIS